MSLQADDCYNQEQGCIKNCKLRINHLQDRMDQLRKDLPDDDFGITIWQRKRCSRFIVDHLLRHGYYKAAIDLIEEADIKVRCIAIDNFINLRVELILANGPI